MIVRPAKDLFTRFKGYVGPLRMQQDTRHLHKIYQRPVYRFDRRKFLGLGCKAAMYGLAADVLYDTFVLDGTRWRFMATVHAAENIIPVANGGPYSQADLSMASGDASTQNVYQATTYESATFLGGSTNGTITLSYVTLRGFRINGNSDPSYPTTARALHNMSGVGIRIEDSYLLSNFGGFHAGYQWDTDGDGNFTFQGASVCDEDNPSGFPTGGIGKVLTGGEVTFYRSRVEGWRDLMGAVAGTGQLTMDQCLAVYGFEGIKNEGALLHWKDSAIWNMVNHAMGMENATAGTTIMDNTLMTMFQNIWGVAGAAATSGDILRVTKSTFFTPSGWHCAGGTGGTCDGLRSEILVRDNVFMLDDSPMYTIRSTGSEGDQSAFTTSDYNAVNQIDGVSTKFGRWDGTDRTFAQWRSLFPSFDANSVDPSQDLVFVDPLAMSSFPDPGTAANNWGLDDTVPRTVGNNLADLNTVRARLLLHSTSPGYNAASDGLSMGIRVISGGVGGGRRRPVLPRGRIR